MPSKRGSVREWIELQHDPRDLLPIRTFRVGVEHTQIGDRVFVIVWRQRQIRRRGIDDIRIKRGLLHRAASNPRV